MEEEFEDEDNSTVVLLKFVRLVLPEVLKNLEELEGR